MTTAQNEKPRPAEVLAGVAREVERTGATGSADIKKAVARALVSEVGFLPIAKQITLVLSILAGAAEAFQTVSSSGIDAFANPRSKKSAVVVGSSAKIRKPLVTGSTISAQLTTPVSNATVTDADDAALDSMFAQAYATRQRLAQEGKLLSSTELSKRLQITRQAINQRVGTGSLFTVEGPNGSTYYPAFFADEQYDKRAVRKVVRALTGLPGASKWHFFTSPRVSLGGLTPLDVLAGKSPPVRDGYASGERERISLASVLKAAEAFVAE